MAKLNVKAPATKAIGPLKTVAKDTVTYEGAPAYTRDAKSELFLLAVSQFAGEQTFYEKANDRTQRLVNLVRTVAAQDPEWLSQFLPWLRKEANIRTAAIIGAVEAAKALANPGYVGTETGPARAILRDTITRADEPAEALAYYLNTYGRKVPKPVLRGIADAAERLYNERNFIKWDGGNAAVRMADVIELTHPKPKAPWQSALFKYILDVRHDRNTEAGIDIDTMPMLAARALLLASREAEKKAVLAAPDAADMLNAAGMTWEQVSSWGAFTAKTWEALIPTMGYMALIRNLRNFQEAGISKGAMDYVAKKLADPEEVAKSRQLPFRFLSAYLEATNAAWAHPLEQALELSTKNIPNLPGRTLVLVDTSGSMTSVGYSAKSKIMPVQAGALFGIALAAKGEQVDLYGFDTTHFEFTVKKGTSVLRATEEFSKLAKGGGTETAKALKATWAGHDRVVIVTDEQTFGPSRGYWQGDVSAQIPSNVPIYSFNMVGYAPAMMETSATRHQLGGLVDSTFAMISLLEAGQQAKWPWIKEPIQ